jgi:hypothetical protein
LSLPRRRIFDQNKQKNVFRSSFWKGSTEQNRASQATVPLKTKERNPINQCLGHFLRYDSKKSGTVTTATVLILTLQGESSTVLSISVSGHISLFIVPCRLLE